MTSVDQRRIPFSQLARKKEGEISSFPGGEGGGRGGIAHSKKRKSSDREDLQASSERGGAHLL